MRPEKITAVYFSPVGNTKKVAEKTASVLSERLGAPWEAYDFSLPSSRHNPISFGPDELVVFGTPTYAGRIPNKALPFVQSLFRGDGTPAVPVVTFGNRDYDSSLTELTEVLAGNGFRPFAAGAFVSEHSFSRKLATGRPDDVDMHEIKEFAEKAASMIEASSGPEDLPSHVQIDGRIEVKPYYTPLGTDEKPAKFLKAKPKTDSTKCNGCGICIKVCPMGSIDPNDVSLTPGICIKCQACIDKCPQHARYFDDPALRSHIQYLEEHYTRRAANSTFYGV